MSGLDRLSNGQRVLVRGVVRGADAEIVLDPPALGTVVRCRVSDDGAWVALDARRGESVHPFHESDRRGTHVLTYPDLCDDLASLSGQQVTR